jgi:hypothetical protein
MSNQVATKEHISRISKFRQALSSFGFTARRDALFELLDALVSEGPVPSFPMPSLHAAVEDGRLDSAWLHSYLAQQVPASGIQVFPLDGSAWARPRARTLDDRHWGHVRLERWCGLHERKGADVPYDVVRASVHLERQKRSLALWLVWLAPGQATQAQAALPGSQEATRKGQSCLALGC